MAAIAVYAKEIRKLVRLANHVRIFAVEKLDLFGGEHLTELAARGLDVARRGGLSREVEEGGEGAPKRLRGIVGGKGGDSDSAVPVHGFEP